MRGKKEKRQKTKMEKVKDWMWDFFDFRYGIAEWTKSQRLLKKSDLTDKDAEMYEEYYDDRTCSERGEPKT